MVKIYVTTVESKQKCSVHGCVGQLLCQKISDTCIDPTLPLMISKSSKYTNTFHEDIINAIKVNNLVKQSVNTEHVY